MLLLCWKLKVRECENLGTHVNVEVTTGLLCAQAFMGKEPPFDHSH